MKVDIPDEFMELAAANQGDIRLAVALQLYADNRLEYEDACRLAGIPGASFNLELIHRQIPVMQYPPDMKFAG